ncbi:hypothetical protein [uncultured Sphingosinicella sp.]|uniref:hypothetical protein n=1 Tax=uncultured Sphingosinicella sp. TaxID=478748 RepID=UPI0030DD5D03
MYVYYYLESGCGWRWYATTVDGDPIAESVLSFPTLLDAQANFSLVWSDEIGLNYADCA